MQLPGCTASEKQHHHQPVHVPAHALVFGDLVEEAFYKTGQVSASTCSDQTTAFLGMHEQCFTTAWTVKKGTHNCQLYTENHERAGTQAWVVKQLPCS